MLHPASLTIWMTQKSNACLLDKCANPGMSCMGTPNL